VEGRGVEGGGPYERRSKQRGGPPHSTTD
jgi:hypothetical protein